MMIAVEHVTKTLGERVLLDDVCLTVGARDRVALVGANGAGKTTLLRIVAGETEADSGTVSRARGAVVGYLKQEAAESEGRSVLAEVLSVAEEVTSLEHRLALLEEEMAALGGDGERSDADREARMERLLADYGRMRERYEHAGGYTLESDAKAVLGGLGFRETDLGRDVAEFSGGWRMRIALAKLLLSSPDVLLLDEPTNHLDLESLKWLESFLRAYDGAVVIVSHDRAFMDALVDRVAEIDRGKLTVYHGAYSAYVRQRAEVRERLAAAYRAQQRDIAATEKFIERFRYKATKAKQVQSRVKALEKVERIAPPEEERKRVSFHFPQPPRSGAETLRIEGVGKAYGTVRVYDSLDLSLGRGDRVALVGPNGAGKSTLLKLVAGVLEPDSGALEYGHNVSVAYFAQHQLEALDGRATVLKELERSAPDWTQGQLRGLAGAFLFTGDDVDKRVSVLSGGEKARLALAKMLVRPAALLCLDEPTNHLDIASRDVLEAALTSYTGTLVLITHDRHLMNAVANRVAEVRDGRVVMHEGTYDDYVYRVEAAARAAGEGAAPAATRLTDGRPASETPTDDVARKRGSAAEERERKRAEAEARNKYSRVRREVRDRLAVVEAELAALAADDKRLTEVLADSDLYLDKARFFAVMEEYNAVKARTGELEAEWVELSERAELIEAEAAATS